MGAQFFKNHESTKSFVPNGSEYVEIAAKLGLDPIFYARMKKQVVRRVRAHMGGPARLLSGRFFDQLHYSSRRKWGEGEVRVEGKDEDDRYGLGNDEGRMDCLPL